MTIPAKADGRTCARYRTALAEEVGIIQAVTERKLTEANDFLLKRIPEAPYNNNAGESPRKVRYSTAPIEDRGYANIVQEGNASGTMTGRGADGTLQTFTVTQDRKGSFGCNIPGQTIYAGYDVFGRSLQATAFETEPTCILDLITKEHVNDYFRMLREDLPMRGKEQFTYELERLVLSNGRFNASMVNGFAYASGVFPAIPQGTLDVGIVKRIATMVNPFGWTGPFEVQVSRQAFEKMRLDYKNNTQIEIQTSVVSPDVHFLGNDVTVLDWAGIRWVITEMPLRGWLRQVSDGSGYELVPVRPLVTRAGTGEGIVAEPNEDYYRGWTTVNGQRQRLVEVGYFHHTKASTRMPFAVPQLAGKTFDRSLFSMQVNMVDGAFIPNNVDNFNFYYRILHAFGYEALNPELMGAFCYYFQPERIYVNPTYDECIPDGTDVALAGPQPMLHDAASATRCEPCGDEFNRPPVDPRPDSTTEADCQIAGDGKVRFVGFGITATYVGAGNVVLAVERFGGYTAAGSVNYATSNGTAIAGVDYTATSGILSWGANDGARKFITVPILPGGTGGTAFDVTLSGPVAVALATGAEGAIINTVTIDEPPASCVIEDPGIDATAAALSLAEANLAPEQTVEEFLSYVTGTGSGGRITAANVQTFLDTLAPEGVAVTSASWVKNAGGTTTVNAAASTNLEDSAERATFIATLIAHADVDGATLEELANNRWRLSINFIDGATFTSTIWTVNAVTYPLGII